jgi:predicted phosphodiesterase
MRVAALYDIHGNLPALEAVLAEVERAEVDVILLGGDIVTGPMPRQTLDLLLSLGARVRGIQGNADRELRPTDYDDQGAGQPQRTNDMDDAVWATIAWTAEHLTPDQRDLLANLPAQEVLDVDGLGPALFCHGSPRSDEELITPATTAARLRPMLAGVREDVIVCGHTHRQFDRTVDAKRVINAGSVGAPYEGTPGAYWALLGPTVELRRTPYDLDRAAALIRATGFPGAAEFAADNVLTSPPAEETTAHFERAATKHDRERRRRASNG